MFKFLRKYNKWILAVGGTLLMITFLIPFAFQRLTQLAAQRSAVWANVGSEVREKVTGSELDRVRRELQFVQLIDNLQLAQGQPRLFGGLGAIEQPEHWFLLTREAESAGLVSAPGAESSAQQVAQLASQARLPQQFVAETLAKIYGVGRLMDMYQDLWKFSDRRLKYGARRTWHGVSVQVVAIEASQPDDPPQWSEQQLAEHMDKYAQDAPGEGEMGFGYRLPHRVKLEWLTIPADDVRAMIRNSDQLNPVALRKHWRLNTLRLGEPEPGAEVPDNVRNDLLDTLAEQTLDEIAKYANNQLRIKRRGLARSGGYLVPSDGWRDFSFQDLALDLQEKFSIALPQYQSVGDRWLGVNDLAQLPGIGTATSDKFGEQPVALSELVMAAKELNGSQTILIQKDIAGPPLRGSDGNVYLFRIIDADASRPPRSVDEVREAVIADLNKLAHYQQLVDASETLRQEAINTGLLAVAMAHNTTVAGQQSVTLAFPVLLPKIGIHPDTVETIIDHALALPADTPIQDLPADRKTFVVPVPDKLVVLLVRFVSLNPLTKERYALLAQGGGLQSRLLADEFAQGDTMGKAFGFDALAARHNFVFATTRPATTQPDEAEPEPDVAAK